MTRHIRNTRLESRAARAKLKPSGKPYFFGLGAGLHLGYRKGLAGGQWVARRYLGKGKYLNDTFAEADDLADANGAAVLNLTRRRSRRANGRLTRRSSSELQRWAPSSPSPALSGSTSPRVMRASASSSTSLPTRRSLRRRSQA